MSELKIENLMSYINPELINPLKIQDEHKKRNIRTKYDNISVKVLIDGYEYIFSRFNLSRYLRACQIPSNISVDISRKIKEDLINNGQFSITQEDLTKKVFELISKYDSSNNFKRRYRLIQHFNLERIPLIILISGSIFSGKSSISFQLGERLNISTILQTTIIKSLTTGSDDHLNTSFLSKNYSCKEEFIEYYEKDSEIACESIKGEILKTLTDGKPLIIEGIHLDPERILKICGQNSLLSLNDFEVKEMGILYPDKKGIILPFLIQKNKEDLSKVIRCSLNTVNPRIGASEPNNITNYANWLQEYLIPKFPINYIINNSRNNSIDEIHSIFLEKLEQVIGDKI